MPSSSLQIAPNRIFLGVCWTAFGFSPSSGVIDVADSVDTATNAAAAQKKGPSRRSSKTTGFAARALANAMAKADTKKPTEDDATTRSRRSRNRGTDDSSAVAAAADIVGSGPSTTRSSIALPTAVPVTVVADPLLSQVAPKNRVQPPVEKPLQRKSKERQPPVGTSSSSTESIAAEGNAWVSASVLGPPKQNEKQAKGPFYDVIGVGDVSSPADALRPQQVHDTSGGDGSASLEVDVSKTATGSSTSTIPRAATESFSTLAANKLTLQGAGCPTMTMAVVDAGPAVEVHLTPPPKSKPAWLFEATSVPTSTEASSRTPHIITDPLPSQSEGMIVPTRTLQRDDTAAALDATNKIQNQQDLQPTRCKTYKIQNREDPRTTKDIRPDWLQSQDGNEQDANVNDTLQTESPSQWEAEASEKQRPSQANDWLDLFEFGPEGFGSIVRFGIGEMERMKSNTKGRDRKGGDSDIGRNEGMNQRIHEGNERIKEVTIHLSFSQAAIELFVFFSSCYPPPFPSPFFLHSPFPLQAWKYHVPKGHISKGHVLKEHVQSRQSPPLPSSPPTKRGSPVQNLRPRRREDQ
jgi:hypothetical protein